MDIIVYNNCLRFDLVFELFSLSSEQNSKFNEDFKLDV